MPLPSLLLPSLSLPLLASARVGPIQFEEPIWLLLIPICWALTLWIGRRSLSGLGTWSRRAALIVRLIVFALLAGAMAEPQWRTDSEDVAVTVVLDASRSVPTPIQGNVDRYIEEAAAAHKKDDDRLGLVTAAREAYVQALPSKLTENVERQHIGATEGTNLAAAVRLAMAVKPEDAAYRVVLMTDGNETAGSLLQAAEAAKAAGVPIDVYPLRFKYDREVIVDQVVVPANARMGENVNLRVVLTAKQAARGRLTLLLNEQAIDLDPDSEALGVIRDLDQGANVLQVPITIPRGGAQRFEAVFEPLAVGSGPPGDSIAENNRALGVTFVSGQGRVLILAESSEEAEPFQRALTESKIASDAMPADQAPQSLTELNGYDAIVLVNQPAYAFSEKAQQELRQYVHDSGGGLIVLGGPDSFGAGGWMGSPLEDALPIKLDPPQKRQMPRGALALVIHSVEIPQGVFYGKKVCEEAVGALSRLDMAGILEYDYSAGTRWVHPLSLVGDGTAIRRSIGNLVFGDMPDFGPSLTMAHDDLLKADASQRHVIMISDGDPSDPTPALLQKYVRNKITITTVGVATHSPADVVRMQNISRKTGGRHYDVAADKISTLPQIFIKEAQTVKRSLIWEGSPFVPAMTNVPSEPMRGIGSVPPITGYVVTGERDGLALVTLRGKENDPIMAQWQHGLGKVIAYTSDATTRWNASWLSWPQYKAFWEQHVRWAMRPGGSANLRVVTENVGDETRVVVEAAEASGEYLNFATFRARVAMPDGAGQDVELAQVGPGRYEGKFRSDQSGSYLLGVRYLAPGADGAPPTEGSVQAAVTRPFADEYRALEDNTPLLQQVAAMTGGRVLAGDPRVDDLWDRAGLTMPVSLRPIWLVIASIAIGMFLLDVAVRRVRFDIPAMARAVRRSMARSRARTGDQMGGLRAAREKAQRQMASRAEHRAPADAGEAPGAPLPAMVDRAMRETAKVKFEASPEALRRGATSTIALDPESGAPRVQEATPQPAKPKAPDEQGMSRLLKAKKRARDELGDA